ncbi:arylesterase [Roseobacter sp. HKCCD5988]|uniref:arylesterase n=1 Tax=Roseobacter sp. HKCCD5988 TaxID=3120338 RepID=UPI004040A7DA
MFNNPAYLVETRYGVLPRCGKGRLVWAALFGVLLMLLPQTGVAQVQVVALGDSLTQGYGLPQGEGFVPQLQNWINEQGLDAQVVNAGVSGDTTAGGLSRIDWTLTPDVDAVIVALGGNDLLRGIPPATSRANLEAILQKISARNLPVLLVGLPAPNNYGPAFTAEFDAIYPDLAAQYETSLVLDFLGPIAAAAESNRQEALSDLMQPDGIHPNAKGVALVVEALGPEVANLIARAEAGGS